MCPCRLALRAAAPLLLLQLLLAGPAAADESVATEKRMYPAALIDRPLILPRFMFQPTVEVDMTHIKDGSQGLALAAGLDVGLARHLQAGILFAFPLYPGAGFGDFVANLQIGLGAVNLRFDIGTERLSVFPEKGPTSSKDTFVFGLGLPYKGRLGSVVALVGGSTAARGFGTAPFLNFGSTGFLSGAAYGGTSFSASSDLFTLQVFDAGSNTTGVIGSLLVPLGILIQPHPVFSLGVAAAYRLTFTTETGGSSSTPTTLQHSVPLKFDLTFTVARIVDLGFTALILGPIATQAGGTTKTVSGSDYVSLLQKYDFWVAVRF